MFTIMDKVKLGVVVVGVGLVAIGAVGNKLKRGGEQSKPVGPLALPFSQAKLSVNVAVWESRSAKRQKNAVETLLRNRLKAMGVTILPENAQGDGSENIITASYSEEKSGFTSPTHATACHPAGTAIRLDVVAKQKDQVVYEAGVSAEQSTYYLPDTPVCEDLQDAALKQDRDNFKTNFDDRRLFEKEPVPNQAAS